MCDKTSKTLYRHIETHNISIEEYLNQFPGSLIICKNFNVSTQAKFCCNNCGKTFRYENTLLKHNCKRRIDNKEDGKDYVVCKLCGFVAKTLTCHITQTHNITKEEYINQFPDSLITCQKSKEIFFERKKNWDWINRANQNGVDLTEHKKKLGDSVKKSILSNPEERKRRAEQLAANNRTPEARKKSSEAAKKTSARPEIIEARTKQLKNWRDDNPKEFYEKCINVMLTKHNSRPELDLYNLVKSIDESFDRSQFFIDKRFVNKTNRKQVDIFSKKLNIILEFDGPCHFNPIYGEANFKIAKQNDLVLNEIANEKKYTLIRVTYDYYDQNIRKFNDEFVEQIKDIILNKKIGVYKFGSEYKIEEEKDE